MTPSAGNTYLCSGYAGCKSAGYGNAGYSKVSNKMYWRMYSGHNCTNYAAYRVIRAGGPAQRPWSGGGNASEWGKQMKSITDQVPNVGAIAWWGRYSNGSGSAGHVAYVEKVVSSTEIIISEDSWGGTFHWRRITKSSGRWPTGFIHFVDKRLTSKSPPTITGTPTVGATLTAGPGTWSTTPTSVSYNWFAGGVFTGLSGPTYTVRPADLGKPITVRAAAVRSGYTSGARYSAATAAVTEGTFALAAPPTVTGTPFVDEVLTATPGRWTPTPTKDVRYRWYVDGVRLAENTGPTLALTQDMLGKTVKMIAVARGAGLDNTWAPGVTVGKVLAGDIEVATPFALSGEPRIGETMAVKTGTYTPDDAAPQHRWLRDGVPIPGATGTSYRLRAADVGKRVTAQVNLTRPNYLPWTTTFTAPGRVTSPPRIKVATDGRNGKAFVRARVRAPGFGAANGKVVIRIGRWSKTVRLVAGKARVVVPVATRGRKKVVVRYLGTRVVSAGRVKSSVRVR